MTYPPVKPVPPVPPQPCPVCRIAALYFLRDRSAETGAWHFRCSACSHVYITPLGQPKGPRTTVVEGLSQHAASL